MKPTKKHKLLIVDDSIVIRTFLKDMFSNLPDFQVIGTAANPFKARDIMKKNWPDVITLDIEMPRMNGIDFLRKIMHSRPTPVVMVSSLTKDRAAITLEALEVGAVDYFPKPDVTTWQTLGDTKEEILKKVRNAATANIRKHRLARTKRSVLQTTVNPEQISNKVVVIGSSTGGVQALTEIFMRLPLYTPGIVVVQHMPPTFVESLTELLNKKTYIEVKVAEDNQPVLPGKIFIAPGNRHLEIVKRSGIFYTKVKEGKPIGFHIPSVNVLFLSAARIGSPKILGIILTGMGEDGAQGMMQMKLNNCRTIGQDEESSVVFGMPKRAHEMGSLEQLVSLSTIPEKIVEFGEGRLK